MEHHSYSKLQTVEWLRHGVVVRFDKDDKDFFYSADLLQSVIRQAIELPNVEDDQ